MSKRKIAEYEKSGILVYLHHYIEKGYLPEALLNYLARLGWSFDGTQEIFSRAELFEKFSLDRVTSSPASHDQDKLFWIEGEWMKTLSAEKKVQAVIPFLVREGLISDPPSEEDRARIGRVIEAMGDRLKVFSDIIKLGRFFFTETLTYDPDAVKKRLRKEGVPAMLAELGQVLEQTEPFDLATLEKAVHDYAERSGRKMGDVVNPLRVAVTGQGVGPGLYDCLVILGRETCQARIRQALEMLPSFPGREARVMIRTIEATIDENGAVHLLEPIRLSGTFRALVTILEKPPYVSIEPALLSEPALAEDRSRPEEDDAWSYLQEDR